MSKLTNQVVIVFVPYHNKRCVLYLDCTRGYLQFDTLVAIVSVRNNETCIFLGCVPHTIRVPAQNIISSLIAGVQDVHPSYYVYQIATY